MNIFGFAIDLDSQDLLSVLAFGAIKQLSFRFDSRARPFSFIKGHWPYYFSVSLTLLIIARFVNEVSPEFYFHYGGLRDQLEAVQGAVSPGKDQECSWRDSKWTNHHTQSYLLRWSYYLAELQSSPTPGFHAHFIKDPFILSVLILQLAYFLPFLVFLLSSLVFASWQICSLTY